VRDDGTPVDLSTYDDRRVARDAMTVTTTRPGTANSSSIQTRDGQLMTWAEALEDVAEPAHVATFGRQVRSSRRVPTGSVPTTTGYTLSWP